MTPPRLRRGYTEGPYGQLHHLEGSPTRAAAHPTLVLLHQNPSSAQEYLHLVAEMARDRRVVAFDTPGNGMSDPPPGPLSMAGYAEAFAAGVDALGLTDAGPIDLFGFHTGTYLCAELALRLGPRVGRVVMSGIPFRSPEERSTLLADARATAPLDEDGTAVFKRLNWLWKFLVVERDRRVPLDRAARIFVERSKALQDYWWPYDGVWSYPIEERFPLIEQPVLLVQPHEPLLEASRAAVGLLRSARFVELPGLSRDVFEVGVAEFAAELRRFLT